MAITETIHDALASGVDEVLFVCNPDRPTVPDNELRQRIVRGYAELARAYLELKAPSRRALSNIAGTGLSLDDYTDVELLEDLAALRRACAK